MVLPVWAFWIALFAMIVGVVGVIVPAVPGVGLIWIVALIYAIAERFATIDPFTFAALTILGALGVTSDIWITQVGGKLGGASWKALLASLGLGALGFVIGLVFGGIGAAPLGILGAIGGIILVEYHERRNWREATQAGVGWAVGCLASWVFQLVIGLTMIFIFAWQVLKG
jgi:uncharacterized protein YqgC (DUF456 family)